MKILSRYILWEHVGPFIFALTTLTSLLMLNQVAKQFGRLVGKGLSWAVIGEFFALSIPFIIAMSLPMAVLVAVLYAFSRLGAENEVTALRATGVSVFRLVRPVLGAAVLVAAFMLYFNDQVLPASNVRLATLQSDIARTKPTFALREQVINEVSPGRLYLRAARVDDATAALRGVTIYDLSDPMRRRTIYADSGVMSLAENRQDLQLRLYNGYSQEVPMENPAQLQRVYFGVDHVRVRGVASEFDRTEETVSRSEREMSICQMQEHAERRQRDLMEARRQLEVQLGGSAWRLATGQSKRYSVEPSPVPTTLPALYCRHIVPLFGVRSAEAREPARAQVADTLGAAAAWQHPMSDAQRKSRSSMLRDDDAAAALAKDSAVPVPLRPQAAQVREELNLPLVAEAVDITSLPAAIEMQRIQLLESRYSLAKLTLEMHKKFALATACIVFVLIGAPIALRFPRGGVGLVIGASLAVFSVYYVGLIAGESLADKLVLNPVLAMWMANIVFTILGSALLWQARRSGATTRGGDVGEMLDQLRTRVWLRLGRSSPVPAPSSEGVH